VAAVVVTAALAVAMVVLVVETVAVDPAEAEATAGAMISAMPSRGACQQALGVRTPTLRTALNVAQRVSPQMQRALPHLLQRKQRVVLNRQKLSSI
jgi:hypothetical protein